MNDFIIVPPTNDYVSPNYVYVCVETMTESATTPSGKEVYDEISKVPGLLQDHVLKAVKIFMKSPAEFEMLKGLPEEQKLEWVLLNLE